jgi:hypothetical protein
MSIFKRDKGPEFEEFLVELWKTLSVERDENEKIICTECAELNLGVFIENGTELAKKYKIINK